MPKTAVSVTLDDQNLLWMKARARVTRARSLSAALDDLVTAARTADRRPGAARSIVGSMEIPEDDPDLTQADALVRRLFGDSMRQPVVMTPATRSRKRLSSHRG